MKLRNTVLWRVLFIFLTLVIPWIIISILFLSIANSRILESNLNMTMQSRNFALESFEEQLENIGSTARSGNTLSKTLYLSVMSDQLTGYNRTEATEQIYDSLSPIFYSNTLVETARVYSLPLKTCFSGANAKGWTQTIKEEEFYELAESLQTGNELALVNGKPALLIPNSYTSPVCIMEVELSKYQLRHRITSALELPNESLFSIALNDGEFRLSNIKESELISFAVEKSTGLKTGEIIDLRFGSTDYWLYVYRSSDMGFEYFELIPNAAFTRATSLSMILLAIFMILSVGVIAVFFVQSVKLIHRPLQNLNNSFDKLRHGELTARAEHPETKDFSYLYDNFNHMAAELEQLVSENYKQQILLQKAELNQLQAQINPHFLYNSFFWLQRVVSSGDIEQAEQLTRELGIYFRYITKKNSDTVMLREENEHAKIYANLQAVRFTGRIEVEFGEMPQEFEDIQVPKLFLQPLIENAFKYGLEDKLSDGILKVEYRKTEDGLVITVEDNGELMTDEVIEDLNERLENLKTDDTAAGLSGMLNIARRLQIYYHSDNCFAISRSSLGGLCVAVRLICENKRGDD